MPAVDRLLCPPAGAMRSAVGLAVLLASAAAAAADPPVPAIPPAGAIPVGDPISDGTADSAPPPNLFVSDRLAARRLRLGEARIADGVYDEAVDLLQAVLDAEEDSVAPAGEASETFRSLKGRALDLLEELPPDGERIYELKYGFAARKRLEDGLASGDWDAVEAVSRRFFHTAAGREATYRVAVRAQDRGEALYAALLFRRLREAAPREFEPELSLRSSAAWLRAGLRDPAREAARRFLAQARADVGLAGDAVPEGVDADGLLAWLERDRGHASESRRPAWPTFGGEPDRTSDVPPVTVAGGAEWSFEFNTRSVWDGPRESANAARLVETLAGLSVVAAETGELTQPAFHPIVAGDVAVFRTLRNLQAVDLSSGEFLWRTEHPHDVLFDRALDESNLYLPGQFGRDFGRSTLLEEYVAQSAWRNLTTGTLSTDGRYVFAVEGAGFSTTGGRAAARLGGPRDEPIGSDAFNNLYAYELAAEGRIAWTAGGPPVEKASTGLFFLGPPLPLGGRLYALAEEDGEIRLVVLDPVTADADERIVWSQTLVAAEHPVTIDPLRRISGLAPSFSDGVLICPTGAGAVVGVDLGRRLLLWAYQYPRNIAARADGALRGNPFIVQPPPYPDDEVDRWLDAVPLIADDAVFLTPRDSDELHCVALQDGQLRWKLPRGAMLYLAAVYDGKAVVVGRRSVGAYDAATGEPVWERPLGLTEPAGRGVRSGDLYHLPLASGEIVTLRLSNGQELGRSPVGEGITPGNLIAAGGRLLSQSADEIAGFRRVDEFEAELRDDSDVAADPAALALRGEDRLHRGETAAGLADLRAAAEADLPRAKRLLVQSLLEGLRTDFAAYRKYETDLLEIADDPGQRAEFLRLLAEGLARTGDDRAAFETYLRLTDDGVAAPLLEPAEQGRRVRSDRLVQARVTELYDAAPAAERSAMDAMLDDRLRRIRGSDAAAALERLTALFRGTSAAAEALRRLAARHEAAGDVFLHEQTLLRLADPRRPDDATSSETAGPSGPNAPLDPSSDRFDVALRAEYRPDEVNSGVAATQVETTFTVRPIGATPAEFVDWRFEFDALRRYLQARDSIGRLRWKVDVRPPAEREGPIGSISAAQLRFNGHLAAFATSSRLVVLDLLSQPDEPRVLWSRDLVDRRHGEVDVNRRRQDPFGRPFGPIGFGGADLLLCQTGTTVTATDPLTGETLWERSGVPYDCEMSGDGEFVVLQPFGRADVYVLRASDGSDVALRRTPDALARVAWVGTKLIAWRTTDAGRELVCRDVARDVELWSEPFLESARQATFGPDAIAVLDATVGQFRVIRLSDGKMLLATEIDADPTIDRFLAMRVFGRTLLFTRRMERDRGNGPERNDWRFPVDGLAYAFDDQGRRLWSAAVRSQYLSTDQPAGLPVLFLSVTVPANDGRPSHRAIILDVRTGRTLLEQRREQQLMPAETTADVAGRTITIAVPDGRFVLSSAEGPLSPPRADGPDDLRQPAQNDAGDPLVPVSAP